MDNHRPADASAPKPPRYRNPQTGHPKAHGEPHKSPGGTHRGTVGGTQHSLRGKQGST